MPRKPLLLAAAVLLVPSLALAHPGAHEHAGSLANLQHLAVQPDHLLALGALLLAGLTGGGLRLARVRARARR